MVTCVFVSYLLLLRTINVKIQFYFYDFNLGEEESVFSFSETKHSNCNASVEVEVDVEVVEEDKGDLDKLLPFSLGVSLVRLWSLFNCVCKVDVVFFDLGVLRCFIRT